MTMLDLSRKHDRASELRAIAEGRLMLNVRNGVTVSRSMLAMIADEIDALRATSTVDAHETANVSGKPATYPSASAADVDSDGAFERAYAEAAGVQLTEPTPPEGQQESVRIGDAVLDWMIKYDLLDGDREYYVDDVVSVLNDFAPSSAPEGQQEPVRYAERLAVALHAKHYAGNTQWKPLTGDLVGLLAQIDNMTAALTRPSEQAVSMKWLADWQGRHDIVMPIAAYNELQLAITRSSEQAVTEEMVEAAARGAKFHLYNNGDGKASFIRECDLLAAIRDALSAAMEAGR